MWDEIWLEEEPVSPLFVVVELMPPPEFGSRALFDSCD